MDMSFFDELHAPIRLLLGDINSVAYGYSTNQLDKAIEVALLRDETYSEGTPAPNQGGRTITPDLADKYAKLLLAVKAALALLMPQTSTVRYTIRAFSVSRNYIEHLEYLRGLERELEDGESEGVLSETEWTQFNRGPQPLITQFGTG